MMTGDYTVIVRLGAKSGGQFWGTYDECQTYIVMVEEKFKGKVKTEIVPNKTDHTTRAMKRLYGDLYGDD